MATDVKSIPAIMRSKGWANGAILMDSWFVRPSKSKPGYDTPDTTTIRMDWVLGFARAREVYDKLVLDKVWQNNAARAEITKMLRSKALLLKNASFKLPFGNLSLPVPQQDADYVNQRLVGMTMDLDDMSAALGNFVLNVVVAGFVRNNDSGPGFYVDIHEVGVYVKDSYDFEGDQFLGFWDSSDNSVSMFNFLSGTKIDNVDFRNWRAKNGKGGDFQVFSDVKRIRLLKPDTFFTQ